MKLDILHDEFGSRPGVKLPDPEFLILLKEEGIRELISDHYELLVKSEAKHLFPKEKDELEAAKLRASDFFIQICGGHTYYNENQGNPMMTKRHEPFSITPQARVTWLECYIQILPGLNLPEQIVLSFWNYLNVFSLWMVNTPGEKDFGMFKIDA